MTKVQVATWLNVISLPVGATNQICMATPFFNSCFCSAYSLFGMAILCLNQKHFGCKKVRMKKGNQNGQPPEASVHVVFI